ncbi:UPF0545 protein C22orf39 homolog [Ischnura elegans]|uniref:UPF0545 protein C22orf39 homolog n=1 Tax=Ischnura elegans TaxID=197161 RepID=UPI001ED8ACC1|nr:UPF0545 protein C22orf39 homolog [Ischnura elegans]
MEETTATEKTDENPFMWLVRPCSIYKEEYSDCTSIKGRFHQYFIHGSTIDCAQWGRDADNCVRWEENKDAKALESLIESERNRRTGRLETYIKNDVMTLRKSPPEDWNKPLPGWMQEEYKTSYLALKSVEMKSGNVEDKGKLCTIL